MRPRFLSQLLGGCCVLGVCSLSAIQSALASENARVRLQYHVSEQCPTRSAFMTALLTRARHIELLSADSKEMASGELAVTVLETPGQFHGHLRLQTGDSRMERSVADAHCEALVEALALLAAMEFEPTITQPSNRAAPAMRVSASTPNQAQPVNSAVSAERPLHFSVAAVGGVASAIAPHLLWSAGLHLGVRQLQRSAGLSLQYGQTPLERFVGGDMRFRWGAARLLGCPLGIQHQTVGLAACAIMELGVLRAEPSNTIHGTARNGWWFTPGLGGSGTWRVMGAQAEVLVGLVRPLIRDTFFFDRTEPESAHRARPLGLATELRIGWIFE
jgi:hypothetical protein